MHIRDGLKAIRHIVMSGAKYVALNSYPSSGNSRENLTRSSDRNILSPNSSFDCHRQNYCRLGAITTGRFYLNNINCYPFNFPSNKALLIQPSHRTFPMDHDEIHIYPIDDELKRIVEQYDRACLSDDEDQISLRNK